MFLHLRVILFTGEGWSLSMLWVSVQRGFSVQRGSLSRETPHMIKSGRYTSYWNAFLFGIQIVPKMPQFAFEFGHKQWVTIQSILDKDKYSYFPCVPPNYHLADLHIFTE